MSRVTYAGAKIFNLSSAESGIFMGDYVIHIMVTNVWLLESPGHQQLCCSLCMIKGSLSSTSKNFNYLHYPTVEKP